MAVGAVNKRNIRPTGKHSYLKLSLV